MSQLYNAVSVVHSNNDSASLQRAGHIGKNNSDTLTFFLTVEATKKSNT